MVNYKVKIKKVIDKNPYLGFLWKMYLHRKDEKWLEMVTNLDDDPHIIQFDYPSGNLVDEKILCKIIVGGKNDGFSACMRRAIDGVYFCHKYGFYPIVRFCEKSLYYDLDMPYEKNVFEYYFEPVSDYGELDCLHRNTVFYNGRNAMLAENLNSSTADGGISYLVSPEYIYEMGEIVRKYFSFNKDTQNKIKSCIETLHIDRGMLGIHIRGTDFKNNFNIHPIYVRPEEYYVYIDQAMKKYRFNRIFCATDDEEILQKLIIRYGEKIRFNSAISRGKSQVGIHFLGHTPQFSKYKLGLDVICDICALAGCGGILSGLSQVGLMARIYKRSYGERFLYDKVINHGINHSRKQFNSHISDKKR